MQVKENVVSFQGFKILLYLCGILCLILIYVKYFKRNRYYIITSQLPTVRGFPFLGIAYKLIPMKKFLYILESYFIKFKSWNYFAWIGPQPFLVTVDLDMIKEILTSNRFINKSATMYSAIDNAIPKGLITSPGEKWKHNRKLMNSTFTHKTIIKFIPIFKDGAQALVERLNNNVGNGECEVFEIIKRTFLDMAMETTMGVGLYKGNDNHNEMIRGFNYMLEQVANGAMFSTLKVGFLTYTPRYYKTKQLIKDYIETLIEDKRKANDGTIDSKNMNVTSEEVDIKKDADIFINRALNFQDQSLFQHADVLNETQTVIAGSFDTVSTQIYSILIMLAMHPNIQQRLFEETEEIISVENMSIEYEQLKQFSYMDLVIKETLRLMPSIPIIGREAVKDVTLNGINVPKGLQVMIPIFILHRRTDLWGPLAHSFNPDNFLPENNCKRHPWAYIPFSKGSRNCIGWHYAEVVLRVMLLSLIRNFKFTTSFRYEDLIFSDHISLRYVEEPKLQICRRNEFLERIN
ncbi:probable cytochrome P450 313a4 [Bactrocera tryoni]|uniref:probable cytochrome P450 313a4 n=1 Tax=Bactrocera tryoni TaxID=59916 RepID=UPI001A971398|nr:probable cytochrome P450 313a4 [Bactrocera tryoni]